MMLLICCYWLVCDFLFLYILITILSLAADSMKPNTLKRHLDTTHPNDVEKPLNFFKRKLPEYHVQQIRFVKRASATSNAQIAFYKVAYRNTQGRPSA